MSFKLVNDLWTRDVGGTTQSVLFVLCDQANDFGECWPSQKLIAWKLGISKRTVIRIVQKLEAQGVLSIKRRFQSSNRYTIDLTKLPEKPPFEDDGQSVTYGDDISDTAMSPKEVTPDVTTEVTHVSPKPSVNHHDESSGDAVASQQLRTPRRKASRPTDGGQSKSPRAMPRNGMAQTLVAVLYEDVLKTGSPTAYKKTVGQAQLLADAGLAPGDVAKLVGWIREDSFRSKNGIDMGTLLAWHDKWRATQTKVAPSSTPGVPRYAEVADPYDAQLLAGLEGEE